MCIRDSACIAIIFFGFAVYNLSCAIVDVPTKKTSRMMMLSRKQQGVKAENLLDVYVTKIAGMIAPYLRIDRLKRNKLQRAIAIAGMEMTPEVYTACLLYTSDLSSAFWAWCWRQLSPL